MPWFKGYTLSKVRRAVLVHSEDRATAIQDLKNGLGEIVAENDVWEDLLELVEVPEGEKPEIDISKIEVDDEDEHVLSSVGQV